MFVELNRFRNFILCFNESIFLNWNYLFHHLVILVELKKTNKDNGSDKVWILLNKKNHFLPIPVSHWISACFLPPFFSCRCENLLIMLLPQIELFRLVFVGPSFLKKTKKFVLSWIGIMFHYKNLVCVRQFINLPLGVM